MAGPVDFWVKGFLDMQGAKVLPMGKDRFIIRFGKLQVQLSSPLYIGFFFFYEGLGKGGVARVSQTDLFRPFFTFFFSVVFLGESMSFLSIFFLILIIGIVYLSKKA